MRYRHYERIEKQILATGTSSILLRWKWGRLVLSDEEFTDPSGRLRWGAISDLLAKATSRGLKLSRREVQYRVQCARTYLTEAQIMQISAQFEYWWDLVRAGFPAAEVTETEPMFDSPPADDEPYDPRPPYEQRAEAKRQFNRMLDSPEANGQQPLPGMRMFLPGFSPDTVGRETLFREAFKVHEIIKATTPQLRQAADRAEREDVEREEKLYRLFDAAGRNLEASLGEGEDALLGVQSSLVR